MPIKSILTALIFAGSLFLCAVDDADAARFGGGRSFGSKPSMQRSTTAPTQQKPSAAQAAPQAGAAAKPGLLGGMGGMLGGLLAGTLLGSLLFGGGFHGGGFMDILLIGLLLFVAFKLYARFKASRTATATASGPPVNEPGMAYQAEQPQQPDNRGAWGALQGNTAEQPPPAGPVVPAGFDVEEFLRGAKMAYTRLQASWDKRDVSDIAQFATDAVVQEIKAQAAADPNPSTTEVLLVNAQLLSVTEEDGAQNATVYFDTLLREAPRTDTTQVREVWHFTHPVAGGSWKLDGIQQVE